MTAIGHGEIAVYDAAGNLTGKLPATRPKGRIMTKRNGTVTRRNFITAMGAIGGAGAAHHALTAMGLLGIPKAYAGPLQLPARSLDGVSIIVIGGGLAGLCAAYRAANAGAEVKVLEATGRYGGRSLTIRPVGDTSPNSIPYYSDYL